MGDVRAIEKAVEALPPDELAKFRRWAGKPAAAQRRYPITPTSTMHW